MSNKKAKKVHCSESATPMSCSTSTLTSTSTTTSARDGVVGRIIPQWSSPTIVVVAENTHTVASAMLLVDEGSISHEDDSPSVIEGWTICVECKTSPSNHRCRKCNAIVCNMCCVSRRHLEGTWWCGACFIKRSAPIQQAIRDLKYNSDDDVDQVD